MTQNLVKFEILKGTKQGHHLASKVKTNKHGVLYNAIMVSPPTPISLVVDQLVSSKKSSIPGAALFFTLLCLLIF